MQGQLYRLYFDRYGVDIHGIDQPTAKLHKGTQESHYVVLKVPGHKYWSALNQQNYAPVEFQVYEKQHAEDDKYRLLVTFTTR